METAIRKLPKLDVSDNGCIFSKEPRRQLAYQGDHSDNRLSSLSVRNMLQCALVGRFLV